MERHINDKDMGSFSQSSFHNRVLQNSPLKSSPMSSMNDALTPGKLSTMCPRVICSSNITRMSLKRRIDPFDASDEDEDFFGKLKTKIDRGLLMHSKENYKPNEMKDFVLPRKNKSIFNAETQNILQQFKKSVQHKNVQMRPDMVQFKSNNVINNFAQTPRALTANTSVKRNVRDVSLFKVPFDPPSSTLTLIPKNRGKKMFGMMTNISAEKDIIRDEPVFKVSSNPPSNISEITPNIYGKKTFAMMDSANAENNGENDTVFKVDSNTLKFTPNNFPINFRNPGNKFLFHMSSKVQKDSRGLSSTVHETTIVQTEIQELLFYSS